MSGMAATYSVKRQGSVKLAPNFTVKEFQCHDGSDTVLVDGALVTLLQKIRDHFGKAVHITSAYRTAAWNKKQGGSSNSYHTKGMAADIQIIGVSPVEVALYAQSIGAGGVGLYLYSGGNFVHVDSRTAKTRWIQARKSGGYTVVPSIFPTVQRGSRGDAVRLLQRGIGAAEDGVFGSGTHAALVSFQKKCFLDTKEHDGICGVKTWTEVVKALEK